jgi:hypothetical protein
MKDILMKRFDQPQSIYLEDPAAWDPAYPDFFINRIRIGKTAISRI